jgi:nitroimidazol reductase NimA-like FMN-containing flavoprotein (pyridoxamine 5'-phosphate oxidase superfamily)
MLDPSRQVALRQHPERGHYDHATIHAILDTALICHVAIALDGRPLVIPMGYARDEDRILLHGALASRLMQTLAAGEPCCLTVTHLDGLVLARSALHHSMNYRSVMVQGRCEEILDPLAKRRALNRIVEHLVPGRTAELRPSNEAEIAATRVVALPLDAASAKIRSGPPMDAARDISPKVWAGVLPLALTAGEAIPEAGLVAGLEPPASVRRSQERFP